MTGKSNLLISFKESQAIAKYKVNQKIGIRRDILLTKARSVNREVACAKGR